MFLYMFYLKKYKDTNFLQKEKEKQLFSTSQHLHPHHRIGVDATSINEGLQLFKRHDTVDGTAGLFEPVFQLFRGAEPMKTTLAVGSDFLMRRAVSTIGDTEEEMYCFSSGKFFSTKLTNDGQHEVVISFFSFHS